MTQITMICDHSPRARHPGMWSQVGLRKHHYEQSKWRWWNSNWAISNSERWCCEKVLHSICQQIWKTHQWPQDWKRSVFIPIPKNGNAKECFNYHTIALISHASKVMLSCSVMSNSATQSMVACQAPLSMGFFRQECWNGLPYPSPISA